MGNNTEKKYSDPIVQAMMCSYHGKDFAEDLLKQPNGLKVDNSKKLFRQVKQNLELSNGDNNDFFCWILRARSFYDSTVVLGAFLNLDNIPDFLDFGKTYTEKLTSASIYPSFFYLASHSIELLLKSLAIYSGYKFDELSKELKGNAHNLNKILLAIKKNNFILPEFTDGEKEIIKNMNFVVSHGVIKYPNSKSNKSEFFDGLQESVFIYGNEIRKMWKTKNDPSPKLQLGDIVDVGDKIVKIVSDNDKYYEFQYIEPNMENSLNVNTYKNLWNKIYTSVEEKVLKDIS